MAIDVAVIGGGIVGAATAAFLAEGGMRVRLYERAAIASGASGRNSGIVQHPFDPVLAELYRRTLVEYRRLADDSDASDGSFALPAAPAGLLLVGRDVAAARAEADEWARAWPASTPEVLAGDALVRLEPGLAPDLAACRLAIGYPVAPAAATEAFAGRAAQLGVEVVLGNEVRPAIDHGRVIGIALDGRIEPAGAAVVTAGPWTPSVVDPGGAWRPIRSSWGVVASVALADAPRHALEAIEIDIEPAGAAPGRSLDRAVSFSLVPAANSSALGSTFLPDAPDPADWVDALRRVGSRYVPAIADAPILGLRACARPVSRDGRPLVGAAPWADGLWIAAGHGPWGISTGAGSARLVADAMLGRIDGDGIAPELRAGRFGRPAA